MNRQPHDLAAASSIDGERCAQLLGELIRIPSVVGSSTEAHIWLTSQLRGLGMAVEQFSVEGRQSPLVLGCLEGSGDGPGVLFDAHYDTVGADPADWSRDPWGAEREGDLVYGRGAVDSKGALTAMLVAIERVVEHSPRRRGPIFFMSDSDGEDGFRGAALMADLGIADRVQTMFSGEATSNSRIELAYPGISAWKITAVGRTAHPTEPELGVNAIAKMAKLIAAVEAGRLALPQADSRWFGPRSTITAIRTLPGGGWTIPARCDAVLSVLTPLGSSFGVVRAAIEAFLRELELEDGEVSFECKVIPMGAGRLWLRPGEVDPDHLGVRALAEAVTAVTGVTPTVGRFDGGWVDCVELMRPGAAGYGEPAALTFGPGDFTLAHAVDEHISVAELVKAAAVYASATISLIGA